MLTNPKYNYHLIDAGRALQNMQLVLHGIIAYAFRIVYRDKRGKLRIDMESQMILNPTVIVGFQYPARGSQEEKEESSTP